MKKYKDKGLKKKMEGIKMLLFDVDGVLTDGSLFYGENNELKVFHVHDGVGVYLLKLAGVKIGLISAHKETEAVNRRAEEMGIEEVCQGVKDKLRIYEGILKKHNFTDREVAYLGDDLPDIPILERAGVSFSVPNGREEVKGIVDYITEAEGGKGALREVAEVILKEKGIWEKTLKDFFPSLRKRK